MAAKRIIPCLDVKNGRVVKGIQFKELRDLGTPSELAIRYDVEGADELVFLDISATEERRSTQASWVREVARNLSIPFTVGGGITDLEGIQGLLRAGADKVVLNSAAVRNPELVTQAAESFGRQCIVAAVDVAKDPDLGWRVFIEGGKLPTEHAALDWFRTLEHLGAGEILMTSIDRDGTEQGFDLELLEASAFLTVPIVASGGAGRPEHFLEALQSGADAALAATLFHEKRLGISALKDFLARAGVPVRR